ncbi:T6SS effector amidase Tae4 family protein [Sorangium sp. So ce1151]|uniref:T6SS effector amidase Tae4 family protein n=1 Tax=Sorangium sp. So ce1151 TaxID=3133332 RepID=UPI003F5E3147
MATVPPIHSLKSNYPLKSKKELAKEMGFDDAQIDGFMTLWANTCAIRMSYCLLKCGLELGQEPGRGSETQIRTGALKGKHYWMSREKLSAKLRASVLGRPTFAGPASSIESYRKLVDVIGKTGGVISYEPLAADWLSPAYGGGHIDVVYHDGRLFTGTLGEQYDLMIEEVDWWGTRGFDAQCKRAISLQFWKADG